MENDVDAEENIEMQEDKLIQAVLDMNREHFMVYKISTAEGLQKFGNAFEKKLGEVLLLADITYSVRILNVFQKECVQYDWLNRIYKAKEQATLQEPETAA